MFWSFVCKWPWFDILFQNELCLKYNLCLQKYPSTFWDHECIKKKMFFLKVTWRSFSFHCLSSFSKPLELVVGQSGLKGNYSEVIVTRIKQLTLISARFCTAPLQTPSQKSASFIHQLYGRWQGLLVFNVVESKALLPHASHWKMKTMVTH